MINLYQAKKRIYKNSTIKKTSQGEKWYLEEIKSLRYMLEEIEKLMTSDEFESEKFKEKKEEVEGIFGKIASQIVDIGIYWENIQNNKTKSPNGLTSETIKAILKDDEEKGKQELQKVLNAYEGMEGEILLDDNQKDIKKQVGEAIADPSKFKDKPDQTSDLTEAKLKAIIGFDVEKALLDKWTAAIDGKVIKEAKIKAIVGTYAESTDKTKHKALIGHLRDKGVEGKSKITETDDKKAWKEFLEKNTPTEVIKTIVVHKNDDRLKKAIDKDNPIIEEMKKDTAAGYNEDHEKCKFNKERYGNPEDLEGSEKPTKPKLIQYLFDKEIENVKQQNEAWKKKEDTPTDNSDDKDKTETSWLPWKFSKDNWVRPLTSCIGILLVIGGIAAAVFWEKISNWWNGPAEGEGELGEDKEEEKENE